MSSWESPDVELTRLVRNQALFREVNERVERVASEFASDAPISFVCECADPDCVTQLELSIAEYEGVRSEPTRFVIAPGHEITETETVIGGNGRYKTVEKDGFGGVIATATDPRRTH